MENATAGRRAGVCREGSIRVCQAAALACCLASFATQAQDAVIAPLDRAVEASRDPAAVRLELNAPSLPRFDSADASPQDVRLDFSLLPSAGDGVGPMLGMTGQAPRTGLQPIGPSAARPSLDLGLHWRHTTQNNRQFDLTAWRRLSSEPDAFTLVQQRQPLYGARVEMKLSPARKVPLLADRGFIGMQLQGGARVSIKRKDGRPMVYYRTSF